MDSSDDLGESTLDDGFRSELGEQSSSDSEKNDADAEMLARQRGKVRALKTTRSGKSQKRRKSKKKKRRRKSEKDSSKVYKDPTTNTMQFYAAKGSGDEFLNDIVLHNFVGETENTRNLEMLPLLTADSILILADGDDEDSLASDANCLTSLLLVSKIRMISYSSGLKGCLNKGTHIVVEQQDANADKVLRGNNSLRSRASFFFSSRLETGLFALAAHNCDTSDILNLVMPTSVSLSYSVHTMCISAYVKKSEIGLEYEKEGVSFWEMSDRVREKSKGVLIGWKRIRKNRNLRLSSSSKSEHEDENGKSNSGAESFKLRKMQSTTRNSDLSSIDKRSDLTAIQKTYLRDEVLSRDSCMSSDQIEMYEMKGVGINPRFKDRKLNWQMGDQLIIIMPHPLRTKWIEVRSGFSRVCQMFSSLDHYLRYLVLSCFVSSFVHCLMLPVLSGLI
jgi:hypothetical protein